MPMWIRPGIARESKPSPPSNRVRCRQKDPRKGCRLTSIRWAWFWRRLRLSLMARCRAKVLVWSHGQKKAQKIQTTTNRLLRPQLCRPYHTTRRDKVCQLIRTKGLLLSRLAPLPKIGTSLEPIVPPGIRTMQAMKWIALWKNALQGLANKKSLMTRRSKSRWTPRLKVCFSSLIRANLLWANTSSLNRRCKSPGWLGKLKLRMQGPLLATEAFQEANQAHRLSIRPDCPNKKTCSKLTLQVP